MGGICGKLEFDQEAKVAPSLLKHVADAIDGSQKLLRIENPGR